MWVKLLIEFIFSMGLFINAVLFLPQIVTLFKTKNPTGLSLLTFAGFNLIQLFIFLHGYLHNDYLLMIGYFLSFLTCGAVTVMIIYYRIQSDNKHR